MNKTEFIAKLKELAVCEEAVDWFKTQKSVRSAYNNCHRGDWLLWVAAEINIDRKIIAAVACDYAETALQYIPKKENRPHLAVETIRKWIDGKASIEEVKTAEAAAWAAARAVWAASATRAAEAVACATWAACAARAAEAAARAACAAGIVEAAKHKEFADMFRERITYTMMSEKLSL